MLMYFCRPLTTFDTFIKESGDYFSVRPDAIEVLAGIGKQCQVKAAEDDVIAFF